MRACFLGQNVCALGYGVAMVQTPPLVEDEDHSARRSGATGSRTRRHRPPPNRMFEHLRRHLPHHS